MKLAFGAEVASEASAYALSVVADSAAGAVATRLAAVAFQHIGARGTFDYNRTRMR